MLIGCADPGTATVISGHSFSWRAFNHRLSHLSYRLDDAGRVTAAVVGGTSTTGQTPDLADACDPETCQEFPFTDTADLGASVTRVTAAGLISAGGSASLVVGAGEVEEAVHLDWDSDPGDITVLLSGFSIDTSATTADCYNPQFGWLPRQLALSVDADGPDAAVTASFDAGLSLEDERACLDEAAENATIALTVDVVALSGVQTRAIEIEQSANYELGTTGEPDEQLPPVGVAVAGALGWSSWKWSFHGADSDGRGAYLRSVKVAANAEVAEAAASNYSPATQLSGFDFHFGGRAISMVGGDESVEFSRVELAREYTPTLDSSGAAIAVGLE